MPFINWSKNLETGIDSVDEQHHILLDILNSVHASMAEGDVSAIDASFKKLMEYTDFHFAHEEKLFAQFNYPFTASHKREHEKLKLEAQERIAEYKAGAIEMIDILAFLIDWLQEHIATTDKRFGDYLRLKKIISA